MKKLVILIATLLMIIAMCSCSAFEKTEAIPLTLENIDDYLVLEKSISGGTLKSSPSIVGYGIKDYEGDGTISIKATKIAEANFENVSIKIQIILNRGGLQKQWRFSSGGRFEKFYDDDNGTCRKDVNMTISYDGVGEITENAYFELDEFWINYISDPMDLSPACQFEITEVSGNVIVPKG